MMTRPWLIAAMTIPLILNGSGAFADPETDQLREQLRATVLQLRQLQDQMAAAPPPAAASAPDAGVTAKLAATQAQLRAARLGAAKYAKLQVDFDKLQAQYTALTAAQTAAAAQLENKNAAYAQSFEAGRALASERDRLKTELARMTTIATACQAKNTRLIAFAESVLDAYRKVTVENVLNRGEPFLGNARVRWENEAQDREDTVRANRCDPRLDTATPAKPAGG